MLDRVEELEREIEKFDQSDYRRLTAWWLDRESALWVDKMTADSAAGNLDFLLEEADSERKKGTLRDLP